MKNNELFGKLDTNNIEDIELMEKQLEEKYRQKAEKEKDIHNAIKLFSSKHIDCNPEEYDA